MPKKMKEIMREVSSYEDFIQLIEGGQEGGYIVCLESENMGKDSWQAPRFVDFLSGIEQHKEETGIITIYDSIIDVNGQILAVDVTIVYPAESEKKRRVISCIGL